MAHPPDSRATTITLDHLSKVYPDAGGGLAVIRDLSWNFAPGSATAIVGRSGVGKSTLLHLLGGLDRPSSGSVRYGDVALDSLDSDALARFRAREVGFIFQFHHLLPEFDALENVMMPLLVSRVPEEERRARAHALLARVGLAHRAHHRPGALSGGEQQRVALARAIVSRPRVLLADEPTGNLDIETARAVQELLLEVHRTDGITLIVVTHSEELAASLGEVLEMLPNGQLARA